MCLNHFKTELSSYNIEVMTGTEVTNLDDKQQKLFLNNSKTLSYDKVLVATGGSPVQSRFDTGNIKGVFTIRDLDNVEDIQNYVVGKMQERLGNEVLMEKDDRCTRIAKRKYDTWPSAYASGAVVRCRRGEIWKGMKEEKNLNGKTAIKTK